MARRAEELNFDSLWVTDHLLYRFEGQEDRPAAPWECWTILAGIAASTRWIQLGPLVTCTSFRNPALLAKMADTVDEMSGGRLVLGLGAGWHEPEFRAFGYPFDHRVSRFEEALIIIHGLLRYGKVDFSGKYYTVRECELVPRGPRPSGPPIMIGGTQPRMLQLTARYADAWNVWALWTQNRVAGLAPFKGVVDAACIETGRDPTTLERTAGVLVDLPNRVGYPRGGLQPISGNPEELAEVFRSYARAGIAHVQVALDPNTIAGLEAFAPVLEILDRD